MVLRYHSGKGTLATHIAAVIHRCMRQNPGIIGYAEPFAGMFRVGLEVIKEPPIPLQRVHLNDTNIHITKWWEKIVLHKRWLPEAVPQTKQSLIRWQDSPPSAQRTFYVLSLSFRGDVEGSNGFLSQNYNTKRVMDSLRARVAEVKARLNSIPEVTVTQQRAQTMDFKRTLIYCDPPYFETGNHSWSAHEDMAFWAAVWRWLDPNHGNVVVVSTTRNRPPVAGAGLRAKRVFSRRLSTKSTAGSVPRTEYVYRLWRAGGRSTQK